MGSIANGGREGIRTPGLLIANQATILIRHGAATVQPFRLPSKLGNLGNREKTGLGFSLSPWLSHIQKRGPGKLQQFTDIGASTSFSYVASFLPAASQCFIQLN